MIFIAALPMTPQALRPNVKIHWRVKSKAVKKMRSDSYYIFKQLISRYEIKPHLPLRSIEIKRTFYFNTNRIRDKDNLNASTKSINDGLVDSGLIKDDSGNNIIWFDSKIVIDKGKAECIIYEITPN